jgi:hypothetical protein
MADALVLGSTATVGAPDGGAFGGCNTEGTTVSEEVSTPKDGAVEGGELVSISTVMLSPGAMGGVVVGALFEFTAQNPPEEVFCVPLALPMERVTTEGPRLA